ncbi:MAG TPA: DNA polymerase III subunit gamma/tau, partial [Rhizomicrobium sp.]|nr:DNA polymerase III subunit gamma/tau [Rhizomicrobium sp.]
MTDAPAALPYRVLARKYRPTSFPGLIGQEAMVRTLKNAIESGRLAHAFMLTGVRGVGKTTTARIIARALNCIGKDGKGGPTVDPCGVCENCIAIAEDRHVDVLEMDAASRTGIGDIREIIEGVRYKPASARFKVYIIDEVHMLSNQAFNGLLKTLEEPPPHVKFIFATTEIRKVPVTVLSRCQRFDLRRVDIATLSEHFTKIAQAEKIEIAPEALAMIARAADGSVRDGLSLLDQAIAHGGG